MCAQLMAKWFRYILPKYVSWFGMYSCISDSNLAISCESLVMLHNSSALKSGVICLHNRIWLITFPKFDGPARLSEMKRIRRKIYDQILMKFYCEAEKWTFIDVSNWILGQNQWWILFSGPYFEKSKLYHRKYFFNDKFIFRLSIDISATKMA